MKPRHFLAWARNQETDECIEWPFATNNYGYGFVQSDASGVMKMGTAHRAQYQICLGCGPMPPVICHRCDNPKCVNPRHLHGGTHRTNITDWYRRCGVRTTLNPYGNEPFHRAS